MEGQRYSGLTLFAVSCLQLSPTYGSKGHTLFLFLFVCLFFERKKKRSEGEEEKEGERKAM